MLLSYRGETGGGEHPRLQHLPDSQILGVGMLNLRPEEDPLHRKCVITGRGLMLQHQRGSESLPRREQTQKKQSV